jgi:hydroxyacylglutathione hydrolase
VAAGSVLPPERYSSGRQEADQQYISGGKILSEIKIIDVSMPFGFGQVNCYLITTGKGFILIDTGTSNQRAMLERELEGAGCMPGDLRLIVITHGDFDHIGNAAYLRKKFDSKIGMHPGDSGMAERGDMFWGRKKSNPVVRMFAPLLVRFKKADRFSPDVPLGDGSDLSEYGFDARILSIPGHSRGSIGILTAEGELFCGDLLTNQDQPFLNSIMDNLPEANASVDRLLGEKVGTVYPGHGEPFPMASFIEHYR